LVIHISEGVGGCVSSVLSSLISLLLILIPREEWSLWYVSVSRWPDAIVLIILYSRVASRIQISLAPKDCIKKDARLSRLDSSGFDVIISIDKGWFEDISQNFSWESSEEEVNGFFTSLGVSALSAEVFKFCNVFFNVWKSHPEGLEFYLRPLLLIRVLELVFKFVYKLVPHIRDVVGNGIEPVNPDFHIAYPSLNIRSFDKGEGNGNFLDGGVESSDVLVDSEVSFNFFNESICFSSCSIKYSR
jgi:hypothetical protein